MGRAVTRTPMSLIADAARTALAQILKEVHQAGADGVDLSAALEGIDPVLAAHVAALAAAAPPDTTGWVARYTTAPRACDPSAWCTHQKYVGFHDGSMLRHVQVHPQHAVDVASAYFAAGHPIWTYDPRERAVYAVRPR